MPFTSHPLVAKSNASARKVENTGDAGFSEHSHLVRALQSWTLVFTHVSLYTTTPVPKTCTKEMEFISVKLSFS